MKASLIIILSVFVMMVNLTSLLANDATKATFSLDGGEEVTVSFQEIIYQENYFAQILFANLVSVAQQTSWLAGVVSNDSDSLIIVIQVQNGQPCKCYQLSIETCRDVPISYLDDCAFAVMDLESNPVVVVDDSFGYHSVDWDQPCFELIESKDDEFFKMKFRCQKSELQLEEVEY